MGPPVDEPMAINPGISPGLSFGRASRGEGRADSDSGLAFGSATGVAMASALRRRRDTTFTCESVRTARRNLMPTICQLSVPVMLGFGKTSSAPASMAENGIPRASYTEDEVTMRIGVAEFAMISCVASSPSFCGMSTSIRTMSGRSFCVRETASLPLRPSAITWISPSSESIRFSAIRTVDTSSTMTTRIMVSCSC